MSLQECYYLWFWVPLSYAQSSFDQSLESLHKFRNQKMRICASSSENFMVPAACSSLYVYVEIRLTSVGMAIRTCNVRNVHLTLLEPGFPDRTKYRSIG